MYISIGRLHKRCNLLMIGFHEQIENDNHQSFFVVVVVVFCSLKANTRTIVVKKERAKLKSNSNANERGEKEANQIIDQVVKSVSLCYFYACVYVCDQQHWLKTKKKKNRVYTHSSSLARWWWSAAFKHDNMSKCCPMEENSKENIDMLRFNQLRELTLAHTRSKSLLKL